MRMKSNLAADGALMLTTLIWGSTFFMAKDILGVWPPMAYMFVRFQGVMGNILVRTDDLVVATISEEARAAINFQKGAE